MVCSVNIDFILMMRYIIPVCTFIAVAHGLDMNFYSTFSFDEDAQRFGVESSITDFISLGNDPKSNLPDSFTICSSILLKFMNTGAHFVQMYTENGSHWFNFQISILESSNVQTRLFYMDPSTGAYQQEPFNDNSVPVIPHSWCHVCLGLDTDSGHLRIVINGVTVVDMEKQYLKNNDAIKPKSLIGKVAGKDFCLCKNYAEFCMLNK